MKLNKENIANLYETLKGIALDNFDSVFDAVEWTIEMMKKLVDIETHELKIPLDK